MVPVAFSPVPRVLNGKANVEAAGKAVRQSPFKQKVPVARVVLVALVVVPKVAVKDWRVVEPTTKRAPAPLKEEVAVLPKKALPISRIVVVPLARLKPAGMERVQVRLVERSWAPALEVIWLAVPAMVRVVPWRA